MPRRKGAYSPAQLDEWRNRIKIGKAIKVINLAIEGDKETLASLTIARMKAIEIAFRKTLPDLSSVEISGGSTPVSFTWGPAIPESVEGPTVIEGTAKQLEPRYKGKVPEGMVIEADKALDDITGNPAESIRELQAERPVEIYGLESMPVADEPSIKADRALSSGEQSTAELKGNGD